MDELNKELIQLVDEVNILKTEESKANTSQELSAQYIQRIHEIANLKSNQVNDHLFEQITKKIIVYPDNVLEIHLSVLPKPIKLKYSSYGRGEQYGARFEVI